MWEVTQERTPAKPRRRNNRHSSRLEVHAPLGIDCSLVSKTGKTFLQNCDSIKALPHTGLAARLSLGFAQGSLRSCFPCSNIAGRMSLHVKVEQMSSTQSAGGTTSTSRAVSFLRGRSPYYGGWGSGHVSLVRQRQSEGHGGDASSDIDCRGRRP